MNKIGIIGVGDIKRFRELKAYLQDHPPKFLQNGPNSSEANNNVTNHSGGSGNETSLSSSSNTSLSACQLALQKLEKQRKRDGRPFDLSMMNPAQLNDEKTCVRKELGALKSLFASKDENVRQIVSSLFWVQSYNATD